MKTIYIMHPSVDYLLDDEGMQEEIEQYIREETVTDLSVPLAEIDKNCISQDTDIGSLFRGITMKNLKDILDGPNGAYINPFAYGISHDTNYTINVLKDLEFEYSFQYITPSFDVYMEAVNRTYSEDDYMYQVFLTEKEQYEEENTAIKELVGHIEQERFDTYVTSDMVH